MKKLLTLAFALVVSVSSLMGQGSETGTEFSPHGAPILKVYTNVHNTWQGEGSKAQFQITRAYLGYEYNFSEHFYGKLVLDVGDPGVGGIRNIAFLKNAFLRYRTGGFSASVGMISSNQYELQEKVWGHRYLYKSFQDEYRFGPSADMGLMLDYKIADWVSVDAALMNGEGYKLIQLDSAFKASFGATFTVLQHLKIRGYYDFSTTDTIQQTIATFIGWAGNRWTLAGEYNIQINHLYMNENNFSGFSFYGSFDITKKIGVFARYDYLDSSKPSGFELPWNFKRDGQLILAGIQYSPIKYVNIAPNFQMWSPADGSIPVSYGAYLNFEFKL